MLRLWAVITACERGTDAAGADDLAATHLPGDRFNRNRPSERRGHTPVIVDGVVYTLAYNGNLTALDLRSGQIMWKRELGSVNDFIVDGNRIYMVDQNDRLLALSTEGGVTLWTQSDLLHRLLTAPALYNGSLVVGDSEGYMHWVDPENGRFVAQQKVDGSGFLTDPVVADGKLLIQAKDGTLYAITR